VVALASVQAIHKVFNEVVRRFRFTAIYGEPPVVLAVFNQAIGNQLASVGVRRESPFSHLDLLVGLDVQRLDGRHTTQSAVLVLKRSPLRKLQLRHAAIPLAPAVNGLVPYAKAPSHARDSGTAIYLQQNLDDLLYPVTFPFAQLVSPRVETEF
jgi:hypothetical protein